MLNVKRIRKQFDIYKKYPNLRFFDSAASSLKHQYTINQMTDYLKYNGTNVHRGVYSLAASATNLYEQARIDVANFINANTDEVIFTKSTTHAMNMLAHSLEDQISFNDEIIISELEHHSNLLPWERLAKTKGAHLKFIPLENGKITLKHFKKVLSPKTKLVITHTVSNVLGYQTPLIDMIKLSHMVNAVVIVDAAQSISHQKLDVKALDVDYVAFSGHKMYGPNGIGVLYGKKMLLDHLSPSEFGGEMVDKVLVSGPTYKEAPYKFEAGTPAIAEAIGLSGAISFLNEVGLENIYKHEKKLRKYVYEALKDEMGITIFNKDNDTALFTFNIDGVHPHDTASFLDQKEVCVRAGHHCNQLTMKYLNQDSTVRVSFGPYNTLDDCNVLIESIKETRDFFVSLKGL